MSSQEQSTSDAADRFARSTGASKPTCPTCNQRMAVKVVMPVLFAGELDDVTYACEGCGVEVKRTVKRS